jgi:hypothetical protein
MRRITIIAAALVASFAAHAQNAGYITTSKGRFDELPASAISSTDPGGEFESSMQWNFTTKKGVERLRVVVTGCDRSPMSGRVRVAGPVSGYYVQDWVINGGAPLDVIAAETCLQARGRPPEASPLAQGAPGVGTGPGVAPVRPLAQQGSGK